MCGRFEVDRNNQEIGKLLAQLSADTDPIKTGEVFPANNALVLISHEKNIVPFGMLWGFPRWNGKGIIINARAETALSNVMFKKALLDHPAVIPTTGFYEWLHNGTSKKKFIFREQDSQLLYLAGFWKYFEGKGNCFVILTTAANKSLQVFHERMPVLLEACEQDEWLKGKNREKVLQRTPPALIWKSV